MKRPMTADQLAAHDGISSDDKQLIEETINRMVGGDDLRTRCLRAFLVQLWEESEPDESMRQEIGGDAAAWLDGWEDGVRYGDPDLCICRVCGCTYDDACLDPQTGEPCHWVEDDLCSACQK